MVVTMRPYAGLHDLVSMKALTIAGRKAHPYSGYPHIGDLDWLVFYGVPVHGNSLQDVIYLIEQDGQLFGWLAYSPPLPEFDLVVHPSMLGTDRAEAWVAAAEEHLRPAALLRGEPMTTFTWIDDPLTLRLERRGYVGRDHFTVFTYSLDVQPPPPILPDGFTFLEAMRPEWADRRADVHFNSFNPSKMTAQAYAHFMTAPDYDPELDVVVVAPDGRFAAFSMCWIEPLTKIGSHEPVGTRGEMQRRGLGRAVMLEGLRRMRARGMSVATVLTNTTNTGNMAFYELLGFKRVNSIYKYEKSVAEVD